MLNCGVTCPALLPTSAGKIHRHHAKARVGERLEMLAPHRAVGNAGMHEHERWPGTDIVVRKRHRGEYGDREAVGARCRPI